MHGNMGGAPRCRFGTAASEHPSIPARFEKKQNLEVEYGMGRGLMIEV